MTCWSIDFNVKITELITQLIENDIAPLKVH